MVQGLINFFSHIGCRNKKTMRLAQISSLYRYPVKGLSPESLAEVRLGEGEHFPGDRQFALENGPSGFDPQAAEHLAKIKFLMLMRNGRLARLKTCYDDATGVLTIRQGGGVLAAGDLATPEGRAVIEACLAAWCSQELRGPVKLLRAPPGYRFMDSRAGYLSIIDRASVQAIGAAMGREQLNPLRFRANVYVDGLGAWGEFNLIGNRVRLGEAELDITKRIDRCGATDVDPETGQRDTQMVELLERSFGHHDCGVYARVVKSGRVACGDTLKPV
jgi:uncharacterized protein